MGFWENCEAPNVFISVRVHAEPICLLNDFLVPTDVHLGLIVFLGRIRVRIFLLKAGYVHSTLLIRHDHFGAFYGVRNLASEIEEETLFDLVLNLRQNLPTIDFEIVSWSFLNPIFCQDLTLVTLQRNGVIHGSDGAAQRMSLLLQSHLMQFLCVPHRVNNLGLSLFPERTSHLYIKLL